MLLVIHFLYPEFLYGLFALSIPIILHFFSFKKYKKMSPITYKNYLRIIKAADLLKSGEYSVKEAAYAVSLPDICYFYKLFVRFMHDTPKSFVPVGGAPDTPSV